MMRHNIVYSTLEFKGTSEFGKGVLMRKKGCFCILYKRGKRLFNSGYQGDVIFSGYLRRALATCVLLVPGMIPMHDHLRILQHSSPSLPPSSTYVPPVLLYTKY